MLLCGKISEAEAVYQTGSASNHTLYLTRGNSMTVDQSNLFSAVSEHRKTPKACESCGKIIPSHKHKYCDAKCKYDRVRVERTHTHCSHCGNEIGKERSVNARYCSDKCREAERRISERESGNIPTKLNHEKSKACRAQAIEKHNSLAKSGAVKTCIQCGIEKNLGDFYVYSSSCKICRISHVKKTQQGFSDEMRSKYLEKKKSWKKKNSDKVKLQAINYRVKVGDTKYQQHVKDWRKWLNAERAKLLCDAHVKCFSAWKKTPASRGWFARKLKAEGRPWANPHFSGALRYKIKYRTSLEFRLSEINRNTWRKEILAERDDGTINFWELMRERKTCPYCLTPITKDNAVADHMIPIKLG